MPEAEVAGPREPALLDWNDDRLAFLGNQEIDRPRPLCRARVPDEVNSLVRIGTERPRFHHVRRGSFRLMGQGTFEHVKKFRSACRSASCHKRTYQQIAAFPLSYAPSQFGSRLSE